MKNRNVIVGLTFVLMSFVVSSGFCDFGRRPWSPDPCPDVRYPILKEKPKKIHDDEVGHATGPTFQECQANARRIAAQLTEDCWKAMDALAKSTVNMCSSVKGHVFAKSDRRFCQAMMLDCTLQKDGSWASIGQAAGTSSVACCLPRS